MSGHTDTAANGGGGSWGNPGFPYVELGKGKVPNFQSLAAQQRR
jgi:hypothetical protein